MKECGKVNEYDGLILAVVFALGALVAGIILSGCTAQWPDIGGGVRVEKIRIMNCSEHPTNCERRV